MAPGGMNLEHSRNAVGLDGRYEILPDRPLPDLDSPPAAAYAARALDRPGDRLYALICDPTPPPRTDIMRSLLRIRHPALVSVIETGVVDWDPAERRAQAIILERPAGARLMAPDLTGGRPMPPDRLMHTVLSPIVGALHELAAFGIVHGSIRPSNIFLGDETATLGEGYAAPTGLAQPISFQTIEGGIATPAGRGRGRPADDMYALGVTVLTLLRGGPPSPGADDDEILSDKLASGSYSALVDGDRVPSRFLEPLRGLLSDDPETRWDLEDLDLWLAGQHLRPRHQPPQRRAQRPFIFHDGEYLAPRPLAHALCRHWDDAGDTILGKAFRSWLNHSLDVESISESFLEVTKHADRTITDRPLRDRMIARVLMTLDRKAPIRFRDLRISPDGFGPLLATVIDDKEKVGMLREVIVGKLPTSWFAMQDEPPGELTRHVHDLERLVPLMQRGGHGFGVERCLYELNPELACLSPPLRRFHVREAREILPALEQAAQDDDRGNNPIDRHLAGFIAARTKTNFTRQLRELDTGIRSPEGALAALDIIVRLQEGEPATPMPALAGWLGELMAPVVEGYHNLTRRERVRDGIAAATRSGDLWALLRVLGDAAERSRDTREYEAATVEYARVTALIARLTDQRGWRATAAERIGARLAAAVATGIAGIVVLLNLFLYAA